MYRDHQQTTIRLRDGTTRDLAPGEPVPDGAQVIRVRVPMMLRDGVPVRDDNETRAQERDEAYEAMKRDLSTAWKGPTSSKQPEPTAETAEDAYQRMKRDLSNAWQGRNRI